MTKLQQHKTEREELKELLIKNLPANIKAGNEKEKANIYLYQTVIALDRCKYINFNTHERISFMVFDIDKFEDKKAIEYFKDINGFYEYISEKIGLEPTYILQTDNGFHFAYHLKNHVFTHQKKALKYIEDMKRAMSELLECDKVASNRLKAVWRNPLLHPCYYSKQINYELSDFKELIPKVKLKNKSIKMNIKVDEDELIEGQRNNTLFKYAMKFAKGQTYLSKNDIYHYLEGINNSKQVCLANKELQQISKSVFKYWGNGKIRYGSNDTKKNIKEGIMGFSKMRNLSYDEYLIETKMRQEESARRTNNIRNKEKNKNQLLRDSKLFQIKKQEENQRKVLDAIVILKNRDEKVTYSSLSRESNLDRRTVKKYFLNLN